VRFSQDMIAHHRETIRLAEPVAEPADIAKHL
jgi:uncharacterized protein (DUF305 family)